MKVGDLVELSAYATQLRGYHSLLGKVGIVTEIANPSSIHNVYFVHWTNGEQCTFNRQDLKFARRKK